MEELLGEKKKYIKGTVMKNIEIIINKKKA